MCVSVCVYRYVCVYVCVFSIPYMSVCMSSWYLCLALILKFATGCKEYRDLLLETQNL